MALDIFVPDPDGCAFFVELEGEDYDPPDVSENQVNKQGAAALWLAK